MALKGGLSFPNLRVSQRMKKTLKRLCFDDVEAKKQLRRGHWTISKLKSSRGASNSGKEDWTSASILRENTLKKSERIF